MGRRRDAAGPVNPRDAKSAADVPRRLPAPYEAFSDSPNLIDREREDLAACEAAIDTLRVAFWAAGKALQVIRDARLYRANFATFEEYVETRWQMSRTYAYRLIQAWPLAEAVSPIGDTALNESQVRELLPLAQRHGNDAAVIVYKTIAETDGTRITAAVIKGALSVLPDTDRFDPGEATAQIRAYLAGEIAPPPSPDVSAAELWTVEAGRVRTVLRRIRQDAIRSAAIENPDDARQLAKELRELADEMDRSVE